jgi:hypothetical protein
VFCIGLKLGILPNGQLFRVLDNISLDEEVRGYSFSLLRSYWLQKVYDGQETTQCAQKCSFRMTIKPSDILILRRVAYIWLNCLSVILQEGRICAGANHEVTCCSEHRNFDTRLSRVVALTRQPLYRSEYSHAACRTGGWVNPKARLDALEQ